MRTPVRTAKLLTMLGAALAAAVPAPPAGAAETEVPISGYSFPAEPVRIAVGDSVKWANRDNDTHTVTADDGSFNSDSLAAQGTFTHTFSQPGTFAYHCAIHTSMTATVQVDIGAATEADEAEGDTGTSLVLPGVAALVVLALGAGWLALRRR